MLIATLPWYPHSEYYLNPNENINAGDELLRDGSDVRSKNYHNKKQNRKLTIEYLKSQGQCLSDVMIKKITKQEKKNFFAHIINLTPCT